MKSECNIIRDLLPLYIEDMASDDSRSFVADHLQTCEGCRRELSRMEVPGALERSVRPQEQEPLPFSAVRKKMKKHSRLLISATAILTALAVCALVIGLVAYHLPQHKVVSMPVCNAEGDVSYLEIDVQYYRRLFSTPWVEGLATTTGAGGIHHGGTAKSAATLDGALSTLRDSLNDVAVVIGDKFSPVIKSLAHDITQALPAVQKWVENFIPIIKAPELLAADVAEPWEFQRLRDLAAGYRPDEAPAVNEAVAKKLNDELYKQRQAAAAARNKNDFLRLSAGEQAQQVQAALRSLGYKGSIQDSAKVDKFLTDVQKSAADSGDELTFKQAAYQRDRYAILQKTSASAADAQRQAHTELARRHIVEGGNSMQLARFDATQSAYAMAQQYMAAGMGQQEATRLAATQAANGMQLPQLAAAQSATIAQSRVAVGGGGTSVKIGDAQLDVARRHLNIAEETQRLLDNIRAMLQQRTGSAIPVTL